MRGVSGGERKRVCIGNEIIVNPSLLFLDEPTSGLDSTTALRIVQMLHDIAEVLIPTTLVGIYLSHIYAIHQHAKKSSNVIQVQHNDLESVTTFWIANGFMQLITKQLCFRLGRQW